MLEDARAGCFSHVAVENAERFGRNDTEALVPSDELHNLGIAVRFADYPDLDPIDPDDRILVSLSFTLARRESIKLGQRVTGGLHAKLRTGGFVGKAPDGYLNCEEKTEQIDKTRAGRYNRWIEPDPEHLPVIAPPPPPTRHRQQRLNPRPRPIRQLTPTNHNQEAAGRPAQRRTR